MDRRAFLQRPPARAVAAGPPPPAEPLEVMPGQRLPDAVAARWRRARPQPTAEQRESAQKGAGGTPLGLAAGLEAYVPSAQNPWNRAKARHLLKRTGIGAPTLAVNLFEAMAPGSAVDALLDGAIGLAPPPEPSWRDYAPPHWTAPEPEQIAWWETNEQHIVEYRRAALDRLLSRGVSDPLAASVQAFQDKMTIMWHNHVVTDLDSHFMAALLFRYWSLLRESAFGNFRTLIHEVGRTPAMLVYLNGLENQSGSPNENYARELMELFTMGITGPDNAPNYTQSDVVEAARALTGWGIDFYGETSMPLDGVFISDWHDHGQKTIFGQTGSWGYDDLINLIFAQRATETAHFTCRKIYRTFVHDVPDETIVAEMAAILLASDFEVGPVVRVLLKSQHFFDAEHLGAAIKSPIENTYGFWREMSLSAELEEEDLQSGLNYTTTIVGQELFQPPSVAGWPSGRHWMDTSRLTTRWMTNRWYLWRQDGVFRALAATYPTGVRYDAAALASAIADDWLGLPVEQDQRSTLTDILLNGQPAYEWDPTSNSAENRIRQLIAYLGELPEYQLA